MNVIERRKLIYNLKQEGLSRIEIADKLNITERMVIRDLHNLRRIRDKVYIENAIEDDIQKYDHFETIKNCNFNTNERWIKIMIIGCIHYGHPCCDMDLLKENLKWAKENGAYLILNGDLLEISQKSNFHATVYEQLSPQLQFDQMVAILKPHRERIIGLTESNHHMRVYNTTGINLTKIMCDTLDIPYFGFSSFISLKCNKIKYVIFITHGNNYSSTLAGKIRLVEKIERFIEADIYAYGHVHTLFNTSRIYKAVENGFIVEREKHLILTGHYLNWKGSYSEEKLYEPLKRGSPKIYLNTFKREIKIV